MTNQQVWYIRIWTSSMPIVCQVLGSYRGLSTHWCLLWVHPVLCWGIGWTASRKHWRFWAPGAHGHWESNVAVGGRQQLSKKFPRILEKSRCREFECVHISYKVNVFCTLLCSFSTKKTSRKSKDPEEVARRMRLEAQAGKLFLQNVLLLEKSCSKDALKMCGTGILYNVSWLWSYDVGIVSTNTASACQLWVSCCSEHVLSMFCRFNTDYQATTLVRSLASLNWNNLFGSQGAQLFYLSLQVQTCTVGSTRKILRTS